MDWLFLIEVIMSGLGSGALLALTGIAFVLIYKATKVINLAVGEMLMLSAYFFFGLTTALVIPVWLAIILTMLIRFRHTGSTSCVIAKSPRTE